MDKSLGGKKKLTGVKRLLGSFLILGLLSGCASYERVKVDSKNVSYINGHPFLEYISRLGKLGRVRNSTDEYFLFVEASEEEAALKPFKIYCEDHGGRFVSVEDVNEEVLSKLVKFYRTYTKEMGVPSFYEEKMFPKSLYVLYPYLNFCEGNSESFLVKNVTSYDKNTSIVYFVYPVDVKAFKEELLDKNIAWLKKNLPKVVEKDKKEIFLQGKLSGEACDFYVKLKRLKYLVSDRLASAFDVEFSVKNRSSKVVVVDLSNLGPLVVRGKEYRVFPKYLGKRVVCGIKGSGIMRRRNKVILNPGQSVYVKYITIKVPGIEKLPLEDFDGAIFVLDGKRIRLCLTSLYREHAGKVNG